MEQVARCHQIFKWHACLIAVNVACPDRLAEDIWSACLDVFVSQCTVGMCECLVIEAFWMVVKVRVSSRCVCMYVCVCVCV